MFAMRDEEAMVFFGFLVAAVTVVWMTLRHKHRGERLRTIQRALDAGHIDEPTRRAVLDAMAADAQHSREFLQVVLRNGGRIVRTVLFVVGWLTLTIGGLVLVGMVLFGASRYDIQDATIATAIGFGLVTLPLALREIDGRRSVRS